MGNRSPRGRHLSSLPRANINTHAGSAQHHRKDSGAGCTWAVLGCLHSSRLSLLASSDTCLLLFLPRRQLREENLIVCNNSEEQQPAPQSELAVICKDDLLKTFPVVVVVFVVSGRQAGRRVFVYSPWFKMAVSVHCRRAVCSNKPTVPSPPGPCAQSIFVHQG